MQIERTNQLYVSNSPSPQTEMRLFQSVFGSRLDQVSWNLPVLLLYSYNPQLHNLYGLIEWRTVNIEITTLLKIQYKTRHDCSKDQREKMAGIEKMFVYKNQGINTLRHLKVKLSTSLPSLQAKMSWRRSGQFTWLRLLPDKIGHISFFGNYKRLL